MFKYNGHLQQGVALVEAMVSAFILAVALLSLAQLQGKFMAENAESRIRMQALNLAQSKIEDLRNITNNNTYTGISSGSDTVSSANSTFSRTWTPSPCSNSIHCKEISIVVSWLDPKGNNQTVKLTSNIAETDPAKRGIALLVAPH